MLPKRKYWRQILQETVVKQQHHLSQPRLMLLGEISLFSSIRDVLPKSLP